MKKFIAVLISIFISLSMYSLAYAERECVGTTVVRDDMVFINNNPIPGAQLPNRFVYVFVEDLSNYGFDVSLDETSGKKIYHISRNENLSIHPSAGIKFGDDEINVYTTDAEVYIDSSTPANVFELENGAVLIQSDELAKYGTYDWSSETHTISIDFENQTIVPQRQPFHNALGIDDINDIAYGTIVFGKNRCADIEAEDLREWLEVYWNFYFERVIAPMADIGADDFYIKLWNSDKTKSYTVYSQGIIAGSFGNASESHGEIKKNYIWYMPYVGNARSALTSADLKLERKYFDKTYEEYIDKERSFTLQDENDIPENNLLVTTGCSSWAEAEIQKAATLNLMLYELSDKYTQNITRLDFCKLAYRLIATEFSPESDSRMGMWYAAENIIDEKDLRNKYASVSFTDCSYSEVSFLAAAGIIQGMDDGSFAPDKSITREEAAAILYRMAEFLGNKTIIQHRDAVYYNDENEISDWAVNAVKSMYEMGIMKGINDYDFSPKGTYTVEQAIATMLRLYECG